MKKKYFKTSYKIDVESVYYPSSKDYGVKLIFRGDSRKVSEHKGKSFNEALCGALWILSELMKD